MQTVENGTELVVNGKSRNSTVSITQNETHLGEKTKTRTWNNESMEGRGKNKKRRRRKHKGKGKEKNKNEKNRKKTEKQLRREERKF